MFATPDRTLTFTVENTEVVLDLFNLATLPPDRLGRPVTRQDDEESRANLIRALAEFITQL